MNFNFKQSLLNFRRGYGNKGKTDVENDTNNGKKNMKTSDSDTNNITYRQQSWPSFRRKDKTKDKRISLCHDRNDGKIFDGASKRRETLSPESALGESSATNTSSPVNKRRGGFSGRKWLPQPLRKLSQGKPDKAALDRPLIKKGSDKNFKLPTDKTGEEQSGEQSTQQLRTPTSSQQIEPDLEEDALTLDLPPPMKPIQDQGVMSNGQASNDNSSDRNASLSLKVNSTSTPADLAEIEKIVKEKMEQHQERKNINTNSLSESPKNKTFSGDNLDDNIQYQAENAVDLALKKRNYALKELVTTEESYVNDLAMIVEGYIPEIRDPNSDIPIPDDLKGGKERMVFGNIEAIYEWHKNTFLVELKRCLQNTNELGLLIKNKERRLHMYVKYCQNKPVSEHIVAEHLNYFQEVRSKLKHKLELCDLLIKPIQRIMKYELLLRDILKHTERAGLVDEIANLKEAIHVMKVVPKAANDMMDVGRLQNFDGKITAQGNLIIHGSLFCAEGMAQQQSKDKNVNNTTQKPKELHVFLFSQNIIFAEIVGKKTQFTNPSYFYKTHFLINKMSLEELTDERFIIRTTDPQRQEFNSIICSAANSETYREWVREIRGLLKIQQDLVLVLSNPLLSNSKSEQSKQSTLDPVSVKLRKSCSVYAPGKNSSAASPTLTPGGRGRFPSEGLVTVHNIQDGINNCHLRSPDKKDEKNRKSLISSPSLNGNTSLQNGSLSLSLSDSQNYLTDSVCSGSPKSIGSSNGNNMAMMRITAAPEIISQSQDCVTSGGCTIVLYCKIKNHLNAKVSWRKTEPNTINIFQGGRYFYTVNDLGDSKLIITQTKLSDSGLYVCSVSNNHGTTQCTIGLTVTSNIDHNNAPFLEIVNPTSVKVSWESTDSCIVEYCNVRNRKWVTVEEKPSNCSLKVTGLTPGNCYYFRTNSPSMGLTSLPSLPITMPTNDSIIWLQQQYLNRYTTLWELGRGRFSYVRLASDSMTGQLVAIKQISRSLQTLERTKSEYKLIASSQNSNIIRGLALFENIPHVGADTIVMELVQGPDLFSYICSLDHYSETEIIYFIKQLINGLLWLHQRDKGHLDLKPENIMVNLANMKKPLLKLIDFGDSFLVYNNSNDIANLEFAAPEIVMRQNLSYYTDSWCLGVIIYVLLSGVSPFLDDSNEETITNIMKCDFSFPDEYFGHVSHNSQQLITKLLVSQANARATMNDCLKSAWLNEIPSVVHLSKTTLENFNHRRFRLLVNTHPGIK